MSQFLINPYSLAKDWLLDTYTGAAGAYAVRRLSGSYTGACLRVRRSNDNAEQDIGFDAGGNLDEAQLTSFVGANSGFVTTWYDQSGNARNATQTTSGNQPRIVDSGTVDKEGANPTLTFNGTSQFFNADSLASTVTGEDKPLTMFATVKPANSNAVKQTLAFGNSASATGRIDTLRFEDTAKYYGLIRDNAGVQINVISAGSYSANVRYLATVTTSGLFYEIFSNGSSVVSGSYNIGTITLNLAKIGRARSLSQEFWNGTMSEMVLYASDQSANRSAIETNINGYYSIY
jgi:hypothetical protein